MTDIFTNEMTIIASPDAQVASPKIDGNNIVWADKRNRVYKSVRLYNINEEYEILISDTNGTSGGSVEISGDSVIWKDLVNGRNVLKLIKLDLPKTSATLTEIQQTIEKGVAETDNGENSTQTAGLFWGFSFA